MKKTAAFFVIASACIGCDPTPAGQPNPPDSSGGSGGGGGTPGAAGTTASGGSAGSRGTGGSAGSGGTGGSAGSAGAAGTAGAAGSAGAGGAVDGGPDDVGVVDTGNDDASIGADAPADSPSFDDGAFPPNAAIGSCDPLNWIASASSSAANNPPANAIDGLRASRWSTGIGQSFGEFFQLDFGGYVLLSQIRLDNTGSTGDHPRGYEVATSRDGVDFSNVVASGMQSDTAPPNNLVTIDFAPRAVRTLQIQLTAASGSWWSIHELALACQIQDGDGGFTTDQPSSDGLCGSAAPPPPDGGADAADDGDVDAPSGDAGDASAPNPFDRTHWTVSASNTSANPSDAVANAIDGNIATRWSSGLAQTGNEFFKVDLGSIGCVAQVRLVASGTDFPALYDVSVSTDDVTYIRVAKGTGTNVLQIGFPPRLARFVRIDQLGSSTSWWSIDELAVLP